MQKLCLQAQQALELVRTADAPLSDTQMTLASILAAKVDPDGVASIPLSDLAIMLDRSKATVSRTLLQLEGLGVIIRIHRTAGTRQLTTQYRFWPAYPGADPSADTDPEA